MTGRERHRNGGSSVDYLATGLKLERPVEGSLRVILFFEEHGFGLPHLDVEVRTTTLAACSYWISSLTQLQPTAERPLWLPSLQPAKQARAALVSPSWCGGSAA